MQYSVYKKETIIAFGTLEEISRKLGIKPKTLLFYGTPTYKKRTKDGKRLVKC